MTMTARPAGPGLTTAPLADADPAVADAIARERVRQTDGLELIASENYTSAAVMEAQGSCLTNKYAEGYPGRRYYGGCEVVDDVENLARDRAKELFGAEHANVQPHAGSQANWAAFTALMRPGDTFLAMDLAHGGHLTHGMHLNVSGQFFAPVHYGVRREDHRIDFDQVAALAKERQPKLIVAGASAYPREIDHGRFAQIAEDVGAKFLVDMAHYSGLVAAGLHDDPVAVADVVTSTTHKTLRGPRSGLILCKQEYAKAIDRQVFPGTQGGPLMHAVAGKAVCFGEALKPEFKRLRRAGDRQRQGAGRDAGGGRRDADQRRHGQPPPAVRRHQRGRHGEGRGEGPGRGGRDGEQEHDPVRPPQAAGPVRHPLRHRGPDDPRHGRGGDAAGGGLDPRSPRPPRRTGACWSGRGRR